MAEIALGAVGAGIGSAFGNPMLGWAVGTVVGGLLFPPRLEAQEVGRLDNVKINASTYGAMIPQVWGTMRLPGNVIWATDLQDSIKTTGGKNSPKVKKHTYYANCAVLVCAGPVAQINRIWADDLIIYDRSQSPATKETIRIYLGDETQMPDSLIQSVQGAAQTPAYRGSCYVVFEHLDVTTAHGNRMPNFSFEVQQSATETLAGVITDICAQVGLDASKLDLSQATDAVAGYQLTNRTAARDALDPLLRAFAADVVEVDGTLRLVKRGADPVATVSVKELGASTGQSQSSRIEVRRTQDVELPTRVDVTYVSPSSQYQQMVQHAVRQTKPAIQDAMTVSIPASLDDNQARQIAERTLYTSWREREQYRFTLPPKYLAVAPADVLLVPVDGVLKRLRCNDVDTALPGEIAITGVLDDSSVLTQSAPGAPYVVSSPATLAPIPTAFRAFSGIELQPTDGFYAGFYVTAGGAAGWTGATIYYSPNGGTDWLAAGVVSDAGAVGSCQTTLGDFTGANPDTAHTVDVLLTCGLLEPATQSEVNSGLNQALIGSEVVGFTGAALQAASSYRLSGLTRGELATAASGHGSNEKFCSIGAETVRVTVPDALQGQTVQVKCVSAYQTLADVTAQNVLIGAKSGGPGGASAGTSPTSDVAATGAAGTDVGFARADHRHRGVHSLAKGGAGSTALYGDVTLTGSGGASLTQTGNNINISAPPPGVSSLSKAGAAALIGDVTFTGSGGVTLTQTDNNIEIATAATTGTATKRGLIMVLMAGYSPLTTGKDATELIVPHSPADGTTVLTFNVRRISFRVGQAGTTSSSANVYHSTAAGAFAGANLLTSDLSLASGAYETSAAIGFAVGTVQSGEKLAVNVTGRGTGAKAWTVELLLEEV